MVHPVVQQVRCKPFVNWGKARSLLEESNVVAVVPEDLVKKSHVLWPYLLFLTTIQPRITRRHLLRDHRVPERRDIQRAVVVEPRSLWILPRLHRLSARGVLLHIVGHPGLIHIGGQCPNHEVNPYFGLGCLPEKPYHFLGVDLFLTRCLILVRGLSVINTRVHTSRIPQRQLLTLLVITGNSY